MATETELTTQRTKIITALNDAKDNPKPTYKVGSRTFDWNGYYDHLLKELAHVDQQLASLPAVEETIYDDPTI